MELKGRFSFIEKYFGHESRFSNNLLRGTLILTIGQQIYSPQRLQYFHLAIVFTYMIFLEFFKDDRRTFYEEYALVASVLGCGVVSIVENISGQTLSILYLSILFVGVYLTIKLVYRIHRNVSRGENLDQFTVENQKMLEKGTTFIKVLTMSILGILLISSLYGIYEIIKLF